MLTDVPRVLVGPDAARALAGSRGILLGAQRPRWVDVLAFDDRAGLGLGKLAGARFESFDPWDAVGLSLSAEEFVKRRERLLTELVPGDVVVTERGAYVHLGDAWHEAPLTKG